MEKKNCPSCNERLSLDARFCSNCAAKQPVPKKDPCACCGKELQEGWKVCPFCETSLTGKKPRLWTSGITLGV
ncbi:MAG: zinc ribbon domain-containing protein [Spirochaetes bacterium]|nr:zinc ribbon domain-containing protein [Spirochaetota bacterium]